MAFYRSARVSGDVRFDRRHSPPSPQIVAAVLQCFHNRPVVPVDGPAPRRWNPRIWRVGRFPGKAAARLARYSSPTFMPSAVGYRRPCRIPGRPSGSPPCGPGGCWSRTRSRTARWRGRHRCRTSRRNQSIHLPPQFADHRRIAPDRVENEALEIGRLGNIHRGAAGMRHLGGLAHPVDASAEELVEHVVFVGGQDQSADGETHALGDVAGADIAEVAGWHGEGHFLIVGVVTASQPLK